MKTPWLWTSLLVVFSFQGLGWADPGFPTGWTADPVWEDGPEGAFRPFDGGVLGATFYVDGLNGLDSNTGGEGDPFLTIARAWDVVSAGDTVVVRSGVYHEQVAPPDLGSPASRASPVLLLAEPADGSSVVLDGQGVVPVLEGNLDSPAGVSFYRDSFFVVQGFAIRNWIGYGMAIQQSSDSKVLDCTFADNGTDMNDPVDLVLLSSRDVRVKSNLFDSGTERALDDRATDSWISQNTFAGHTANAVKIGPHPAGQGCRLEHNLFIDNPATQGVVFIDEVKGVTVQRNLVVRGNLQGIRIDGAEDSVFQLNTVVGFPAGLQLRNLTGCRVAGNVLSGNTMGIEFLSLYLPDSVVDQNIYHANTADTDGGDPGPSAVFGDPGFVDPLLDDYGLDGAGAALDAGPVDLPVPEGGGSRVDAGAFEFSAGDAPYAYQTVGQVADRTPGLSWVFADRDPASVQDAYRVQLDTRPDFDSPDLVDSNWQTTSTSAWTVPSGFELEPGRWYVRVKVRDGQSRYSPWSDPHLAYDISTAPGCVSQGGGPCQALDRCEGQWLPAFDEARCCLGSCVACSDEDEDGFMDATCGGPDCDDADPGVHPDADEDCANGLDDDCDEATDLADGDCGCVDHDQDGYGENCPDGVDCDDSIASVHPGADEVCNYVDDDCDGQVDEDSDLQNDPENCGECFWSCRAEEVCDLGACAASCGGGRTDCDRACIDTSSDLANCGGCGLACDLLHAGESCSDGACVLTACEAGWVDSNRDPADGCEYECAIEGDGAEVCDNGLDDDCDGLVDEDCAGGGGGCGCATVQVPTAGCLFVILLVLGLSRRRDRPVG